MMRKPFPVPPLREHWFNVYALPGGQMWRGAPSLTKARALDRMNEMRQDRPEARGYRVHVIPKETKR